MDALFFKALAGELRPLLTGSRIDQVAGPAPEAWTFTLYGPGGRQRLLFKPDRSGGLLFLSAQKPENPAAAPARVMWFRKRLVNRRIVSLAADWPRLRLAWALSPREGGEGGYLVFDLRQGLSLERELPEGFGQEPDWPGIDEVLADQEIFRRAPQISPGLRRALAARPGAEAEALYAALREGTAGRFYLARAEGRFPAPTCWPGRGEGGREFASAIEAAAAAGEPAFYAYLAATREAPEAKAETRQRKKTARILERIAADRKRLEGLAGQQVLAEALQAALWRLSGQPVPESVTLVHPAAGEVAVALNPHLSWSENMAALFAQAAKGRRGLAIVAAREASLAEELAAPAPEAAAPRPEVEPEAGKGGALPRRFAGLPVRAYRSSDGFLLLRGKNAKANHLLVSAARPFDLWFHVSGGPGGHVLLVREHPGQNVPERSRREAAALAALASPFKDAGRAEVMCALARHVRKVKGLAAGEVRVDRLEETLAVSWDEGLESRLAAGFAAGLGEAGGPMDGNGKND